MPQAQVPLRLPLVTGVKARGPSNIPPLDAGLMNCYAEYDPQTETWNIEKRLGLLKSYTPTGATTGLGIYNLRGSIIAIASTGAHASLFKDSDAAIALSGITSSVRFVEIPFGTTLGRIVFGDGTAAGTWIYDLSGGAFPQTLTAYSAGPKPFPPGAADLVKGFAYLDGTLYVMDVDGRIWGSGIADLTTWDPLNVLQANEEPDRGVYLAKHLLYVVAFKQWTTQFFYDNTNAPPGSPLLPVQGATLQLGCISEDSVQEIDGVIIFLTSNRTASPQVALLDNLNVRIVSTPEIDRVLDQADTDDIHSFVIKHAGHRFYFLSIINQNITLVYDIDQNLWYFWSDPSGNFWPLMYTTFSTNAGQSFHYAQHTNNGGIYYVDGDFTYPNDDGTVFPVDIYTPLFDGKVGRRKQLSGMFFNADQVSGSELQVRCNDYDYDPTKWSNFRKVDLSKQRPALFNEGTFYRRAYHFRHFKNTKFRLNSIDLQMDLGTL